MSKNKNKNRDGIKRKFHCNICKHSYPLYYKRIGHGPANVCYDCWINWYEGNKYSMLNGYSSVDNSYSLFILRASGLSYNQAWERIIKKSK